VILLLAKYILGTPTLTSVKEVVHGSIISPRKCGTVTFTADLVNSVSQLKKLKDQKHMVVKKCLTLFDVLAVQSMEE
jgi:hypothetical protein